WALIGLKVAVVAAVVGFVGQAAADAWRSLAREGLTLRPAWAFASAALLWTSQAPMAWYWRRTLVALGQPAPLAASFRAFYVSQLGKYVPGKASVVLIRTERLLAAVRGGTANRRAAERDGDPGDASAVAVGAAVFYETLTHMAVGSLIAAITAAMIPGDDGSPRWGVIALAAGLALACWAPTLPPVFARLVARVTPNAAELREERVAALRARLTLGLAARGVAASSVAWSLTTASVWAAGVSVGAIEAGIAPSAPLWLLAATLPVVAGFVSLLPAGVLVREGLMLGVLAGSIGDGPALATSVAVRLIWVAAEVALCGSLLLPARTRHAPAAERTAPDGTTNES
ncbi:MAG: lysylphosphatidylglycerol synthase domain-containing protein, partial [Planctomycetota bacterium]